jgi:hypothetical protein
MADEKVIDDLAQLIIKLRDRLGRLPTEDETYKFIKGSDWDRFVIWNLAKKEKKNDQ